MWSECEAFVQVDGIAPLHTKDMPVSWVHREQPDSSFDINFSFVYIVRIAS